MYFRMYILNYFLTVLIYWLINVSTVVLPLLLKEVRWYWLETHVGLHVSIQSCLSIHSLPLSLRHYFRSFYIGFIAFLSVSITYWPNLIGYSMSWLIHLETHIVTHVMSICDIVTHVMSICDIVTHFMSICDIVTHGMTICDIVTHGMTIYVI